MKKVLSEEQSEKKLKAAKLESGVLRCAWVSSGLCSHVLKTF